MATEEFEPSRKPADAGGAPGSEPRQRREAWSGQTAFILAAVGSAVGLGNIWRFPGEAYDNGGGAFMIPYLVALVTAGIPILFLDHAIGHRFRGSSPLALKRAARGGEAVGWWHVAVCFIIGLYYTVIIAWALSYFFFSFGLDYAEDPASFFTETFLKVAEPGVGLDFVPGVLVPLAAIWIVTLAVLALGVAKGVEKLNVVAIPLLLVAFTALVVRALFLDGAADGLNALFTPDFSALSDPGVWIAAYGQIFFSLSIAYGIMITYASYRKRRSNVTGPALVVAFSNSSFELLAGIGVFSTVGFLAAQQGVAVGDVEGLTGITLSFVTFPAVIAQMPGGAIFGALFFGSLLLAGLTSLVSVLQVVFAAVQEKLGWQARRTALTIGIPMAVVSLIGFGTTTGLHLLDTLDQWSNQLGIVGGAVLMVVVVLWFGRRGQELARHLSAVSTMKVGRVWLVVTSLVAILLVYMFVDKVATLITEGYADLPSWYLMVFGWGTLAFIVVVALVMPAIPWARGVDRFEAWPTREQLGLDPEPVGALPPQGKSHHSSAQGSADDDAAGEREEDDR
ncbi:sodium-dependent transporter [Demequina globuliformis]|uniref:sodium-dependent transporter n=1 Tax=Demequina globuliformis TaxID=676202 RepID=UPI00078193FA|nr:sodium-dependent transporter [Demequina globuliformis]